VADTPETWISDAMRAVVGKEFGTPRVSLPISRSDIRRWAAAIYWPEAPPRLFWDEPYAATTVHRGVVAPEEFNPFAWFTADGPNIPTSFEGGMGTGTEAAFGIEGPATTSMLNGGTDSDFGVRMRPGDVITASRPRLVEYRERPSRLGLMLVTVTQTTWTNQEDQMVKVVRNSVIRY
jgi:hypothetical protein